MTQALFIMNFQAATYVLRAFGRYIFCEKYNFTFIWSGFSVLHLNQQPSLWNLHHWLSGNLEDEARKNWQCVDFSQNNWAQWKTIHNYRSRFIFQWNDAGFKDQETQKIEMFVFLEFCLEKAGIFSTFKPGEKYFAILTF